MNNTKTYLVILLVILSVAGFAQPTGEVIHGNWEIDFEATKGLMTSDQLTAYNALTELEQNQSRLQLESQEFIFDSNAGFTALYNNTSQNGTWSFDGSALAITFPNGATMTHTVLNVTENEMQIQVVHDASSEALFHKLSLTRKEQ